MTTPNKQSIIFVRNEQQMQQTLQNAKQLSCAHCRRVGTLNLHDTLYGNDLDAADKQTMRGRRLWCCKRDNRTGCGRTMTVVFVQVLPRHSFTAVLLNILLTLLCDGYSIQTAWEQAKMPMPLESVYHIMQRFRYRMGQIRSILLKCCGPPTSTSHDPLIQTIEHLLCAFPKEKCAVEAFQYELQTPIMG